jgi:carnitine O-acetyltransferase
MQVRTKSTYANQKSLPRLPVPRLTATEPLPAHHAVDPKYTPTLTRWLKSIEPLIKGAELEEAKKVTADFGKSGGIGEKLSAALRKRADATQDSSWLASWWSSWAYMGYRDSILINVSYHYIFDDFPQPASQLDRAASMTCALLKAMKMIQEETLQPDEIRNIAQCMSSYKNMFGTCRIPSKPDDYLTYAQPNECQHIIVACKNLFFKLNCFDPKTGLPLSQSSIQAALATIRKEAEAKKGTQPAIGILTAQHRDTWTDIRNDLIRDSRNKASLNEIEKSAFVLNLDDFTPNGYDDTCKTLLHGKGAQISSSNRFFDKAFNIVIFPDGRAGLVGEHSGIDGYPTTVVSDFVWEMTANPELIGEISGNSDFSEIPASTPQLLTFASESPVLNKYIEEASQYHDANVANVEMTLLKFDSYGTKEMKTAGVSPDGYVQMAFQLAYHRLHKKFAPVYESCSTRQYLHGRTEVGRSLSNDAVDFVNAMEDPKLSPSDKYSVFKKACESHIAYIRDASEGYGCDRHILGMKLIAKEVGVDHPFFSLPAHTKTTHWNLSTSQLPSKHSVTGFGPVVQDGYGVFYNLRGQQLNFHISSYKSAKTTDAIKMSKSLKETLLDIQAMCRAANTPQAKL